MIVKEFNVKVITRWSIDLEKMVVSKYYLSCPLKKEELYAVKSAKVNENYNHNYSKLCAIHFRENEWSPSGFFMPSDSIDVMFQTKEQAFWTLDLFCKEIIKTKEKEIREIQDILKKLENKKSTLVKED